MSYLLHHKLIVAFAGLVLLITLSACTEGSGLSVDGSQLGGAALLEGEPTEEATTQSETQPTDPGISPTEPLPENPEIPPTEPPVNVPPPTGFIAFVSHRDGNDEIYVVRTDGTGLTRLTSNNEEDMVPNWSPNGA